MPAVKWTKADDAQLKKPVSQMPEYLYRYVNIDSEKRKEHCQRNGHGF